MTKQQAPTVIDLPASGYNRDSLQALLQARGAMDSPSAISALRSNFRSERVSNAVWRDALHTIWGEAALRDGGRAVIDQAPPALRLLYEEVFA